MTKKIFNTPLSEIDPSTIPGLDLAALFANRFNVTVGPTNTRITFGEYVVGDPDKDSVYHTAIVVPTDDAVALATLIFELTGQSSQSGGSDGKQ